MRKRRTTKLSSDTKSIEPLLALVADITNVDISLVESIVSHQFTALREELYTPRKPAIKLQELGRFELKPSVIRRFLIKLLRELREDPKEETKELFRFWWEKRQEALKYYHSKKHKK